MVLWKQVLGGFVWLLVCFWSFVSEFLCGWRWDDFIKFWVMKFRFKLVAPAWCSEKFSTKISFLTCLSPLERCFAHCSVPGCSLHPHPHPAGSEGCSCGRKSDEQERPVCLSATLHIGGRCSYQQLCKHTHREDKFSKFFLCLGLGCLVSWDFRNVLSLWRPYTTIFRDPSFKLIVDRHLHWHVQIMFVQKFRDFFYMWKHVRKCQIDSENPCLSWPSASCCTALCNISCNSDCPMKEPRLSPQSWTT